MRLLLAFLAGATSGVFLTLVFFWLEGRGLVRAKVRAAAGLGSWRRQRRDAPVVPTAFDPETGFLDRRGLQTALFGAVRDAEKTQRPVALLLVEVDAKERVGGGAESVREVARALRTVASPLDLIARYGDEQFVLVLQGARARDGMDRAQQIRAAITRGQKGLSVSTGIADIDRAGGWHARALLAAADGARYAAKAAGGDRAFIASAPGLVRRARSATPVPVVEEKPWLG